MKNMGSVDEILHLDESAPTSPLKRKLNQDEFISQSGYRFAIKIIFFNLLYLNNNILSKKTE